MSGLFGQLSNTVKSLTAASHSIETTGRNIANVNNASYARQRVLYGDRGSIKTDIGVQSLGIEAVGIQQLRDSLLDAQVVRETSLLSSLTAQQTAYQNAQANLGESIDRSGAVSTTGSDGSTGGIAQALSDFFNAFQSFAANPTDSGEKQALFQKAGILADGLNEADQRLTQSQADLTTGITDDVSEVNNILSSIATLNGQIGRFEINASGSAVDLRDQRQALVEQLATKMSIETSPDPTFPGEIQVFARDASNNPVQLINLTATTGAVALSGSTITAGTPATVLALTGGSINGSLTARDGALATLRTGLDSLAKQIVTSVNAAYNPTSSTGNFFDAAGTTAGTLSLDSTLTAANLKASDGGAAGDNTTAQNIANLANKIFTTAPSSGPADLIDGTFSQFFSNRVTDLGQALSTANTRVAGQTSISTLVKSQRDSVSGVSLDEEMADLVKYQRAFQASARIIQIIDNLLDTVVNNLGA